MKHIIIAILIITSMNADSLCKKYMKESSKKITEMLISLQDQDFIEYKMSNKSFMYWSKKTIAECEGDMKNSMISIRKNVIDMDKGIER